jgi:hypothetical protein
MAIIFHLVRDFDQVPIVFFYRVENVKLYRPVLRCDQVTYLECVKLLEKIYYHYQD